MYLTSGAGGVRYSIENPNSYIQSNLVGFSHILEGCRHHAIKHLGLCVKQFCIWWKYQPAF